jgi:integrase
VPLPTFVADALTAHLEKHDSDHPDGLIFTSAQGMGLRHDGWNRRVWRPTASATGLDAGFHSLRHFCATTLLRRGRLGGSGRPDARDTLATVMEHYAHWITDDAEVVRDVLDRAFAVDNGDNVATLLGALRHG